jgi:hypothetical protein
MVAQVGSRPSPANPHNPLQNAWQGALNSIQKAFKPSTKAASKVAAKPAGHATKTAAPKTVAPKTVATKTNAADGKNGVDLANVAGQLVGAALPDSIVYTNAAMRSSPRTKNFILANPVSGKYTHFINHANTTTQTKIFGDKTSRVEAIQYNTNGTGTRREDGVGGTWQFGDKNNPSTFFVNTRVGDTNINNPANGVSVNAGFFGPPSAAKALVDKIPASGKTKAVRAALETSINAATATGSQVGLAWTGNVIYDAKTKKATLNISGLSIPLKDFTNTSAPTGTKAVNYGNKPIARINNEEAYTKGANPFQRADETRTATGAYLNHTDPVAAIAGDVRSLQNRVEGSSAQPVRSNADAARVLETAIGLSKQMTAQEAKKYKQIDGIQDVKINERAFTPSERNKLSNVLQNLDKAGTYFQSEAVKTAAKEASKLADRKTTGDAAEQTFTRQVFAGKFRNQAVHQYNFGDGVRDVALGLNRVTAVVATLFDAQPLADGTLPKEKMAADAKGFSSRMALKGGTVKALALKTPTSQTRQVAEEKATTALGAVLTQRLWAKNEYPSAEAKYQEFGRLSADERKAVTARVQAELDRP